MFAALLLVAALQSSPEADVGRVIDRLHETAAAADGDAYFALFTANARFIGTDRSERWSLAQFRDYAAPHFAAGRGWTYRSVSRSVTIAPIECRCVAWFDEVLENESYGTTRGSGVLRLTDGGWKIDQYVLSFAVPNDKARQVVDVIRKAD